MGASFHGRAHRRTDDLPFLNAPRRGIPGTDRPANSGGGGCMATEGTADGGDGAGITPDELGEALGTDFLELRCDLGEAELDHFDRTRAFVRDEVLPVIGGF